MGEQVAEMRAALLKVRAQQRRGDSYRACTAASEQRCGSDNGGDETAF
jgi:hypothetical protein